MGTKTIELNAVCVHDWESNHLHEITSDDKSDAFLGGIAAFIKGAGGVTVSDGVFTAFEYEGADEGGQDLWANLRNQYREESSLELPPVMRVKVTVEVEVLTPEESKNLWDAHRASPRLRYRTGE